MDRARESGICEKVQRIPERHKVQKMQLVWAYGPLLQKRGDRSRKGAKRWQPLRSRVMACEEERRAVSSERREAQQGVEYWRCREKGHHLWTYPKKAACPEWGEAQQKRMVCRECKGKNYVTRNCDSYWR